jgi:glycosyltransferase involved in cell wall biosynthesis
MSALVTVVVPVYNVEKYLERCLSSIVNQTYTNLEILLVDDGSTDSCPAICDRFAEQDSRVRVIHKENAGLGMARNTGLDHATGDYICFFDSDDYVETDTIAACVAAAEANEADMVIFGYDDVMAEGTVCGTYAPSTPQSLFVGEEVTRRLLPASMYGDWHTMLSACTKLYSMAVIRRSGWRFVSEREIIAEDYYSLTTLHGYLHRVYVLDRVFYHYTVNSASLSSSFRADRFE